MGEAGHLMTAIAPITSQGEMAVREPAQEHERQLPQQACGGLVAPRVLTVPLRAAIQRDQHGQGPGSGGERELDQDRQDDPLVSPAIGGVALGRADRIAMATLAVDLGSAMFSADFRGAKPTYNVTAVGG